VRAAGTNPGQQASLLFAPHGEGGYFLAEASGEAGPAAAKPILGRLEIKGGSVSQVAEAASPPTAARPAPDRLVGQTTPVSSIQWLHVDHLGSTRVVTDTNGAVVSEHKYLPFGREFNDAAAEEYNTHKYTGHERDAGTGLDYMFARYYGPTSLYRFASIDPIRESASLRQPNSWNRYSYVRNNPLKLIDPDGNAAVGFPGLGNSPESGVRDIAQQVDGAPGIGRARVFRHQDVSEAVDFLLREHEDNPDDAIVIFGHSLGADSAIATAEALGEEGVDVDLVITIDPVFGDKEVPENVETAVNYYQTEEQLGGNQVECEDGTECVNVEVEGSDHGSIDNDLAESGEAAEVIRAEGESEQ
jgi:RHS repeat-associated protein